MYGPEKHKNRRNSELVKGALRPSIAKKFIYGREKDRHRRYKRKEEQERKGQGRSKGRMKGRCCLTSNLQPV